MKPSYTQKNDNMNAYAIIVASNGPGKHWSFSVSESWVKATVFISFSFMLLFSAALIDYIGLLPKGHEHRLLLAENRSLKERGYHLRTELATKVERIQHYKGVAAKLRKILGVKPESIENIQPIEQPIGGPLSRAPTAIQTADSSNLPELIELAHLESQKSEQEMLYFWDSISDRQSFLLSTPTIKPTFGHYSSPFGYRIDPINGRSLLHAGVDIASPFGTQVVAPADGVVSFAGYENGYGNLVCIDHGYGLITRFGHNSKIFVRTGQKVHRWDVISAVGSTGHSTGSHLHYEVITHGMPTDPMNYILQER